MSREDDWQAFLLHLRKAARFVRDDVAAPMAAYLDTVAKYAYRVTDTQVDEVRAAGYSEDEIFEATILAAAAEADRRLQLARRVIDET